MSNSFHLLIGFFLVLITTNCAYAKDNILLSNDIFDIEYAADLAITENGKTVYFVRHFMDIQTDRKLGNIWSVDTKNKTLLPVTTGDHLDYQPTLSPSGDRLAFISTRTGKPQIYMTWLGSGKTAKLTNLTSAPSGLSWSPNGQTLAFTMFVPQSQPPPVSLGGKPNGAKWAKPPVFIDDVYYRFDGAGYVGKGSSEIFIISSQGGTPRQLTHDEFDYSGPLSWGKNNKRLYFAANRSENRDFTPLNSEIYSLFIDDLSITQLTDRDGPDSNPMVSPNGKQIAYLGFNDKRKNYQNRMLYVMDIDGSNPKVLTDALDRTVDDFYWDKKGSNLYIQYDDKGKTLIARQSAKSANKQKVLSNKLGGQSYGRPYTGAEFAVSKEGKIAITYSDPQRPADVAVIDGSKTVRLTQLNEDALGHKQLATIEEIWFKSSADGMDIQGWVAYPPDRKSVV